MTLAAGKLRHRVRIEQYVDVLDSNGEPARGEQGEFIKEWEEVATVWAAIEPLSAREFIQSASMQSQITARITIRYRSGLNAAMRLVHLVNDVQSKIFNPAGFLADKESGLEYLTIPCSEGVNEGQ
jgi:SPP1 family predicted phage head-tail adaptor